MDGIRPIPTLAEMQAKPRAVAKYDIPTRLQEKTAKDTDDTKRSAKFRAAVWKRDKSHCRYCKCKVVKSLELQPKRGEVNHIAGRVHRDVRYDRRNGILLCAVCHELYTHQKLLIVGTLRQMFTVGMKSYLNADKPLQFKEPA